MRICIQMEAAKSQSMMSVVWQPIAVYAAITLFVLWYGHGWLQNRDRRRITSKMNGPKGWPIIGNALEFIGSTEMIANKIMQMSLNYESEPFKFWMVSHLLIFISKPDDLQIVLNSSKALNRPWIYDIVFDVVGESIFTAKGRRWRDIRSMLMSLFNIKVFPKYFSIFNAKNQSLVEDLKKEVGKTEPFDLWEYIADRNMDSILHILLGYDLKQQPHGTMTMTTLRIAAELCVKMMGERGFKVWIHPNFLNKLYQRLSGNSTLINRGFYIIDQVLTIKKEEFKRKKTVINEYPSDVTDEEHKNLLETIRESSEKIGNISDKYVKQEIVAFLGAGSETITITNCFCLLMLAIHQDIQNKVYDEIYDVFSDGHEIITMEDTARLVYLEQALKETIRMYPAVPIIVREIQEDIQISSGNHVLPKGTACVLNLWSTHYNPKLYPNPRAFNPDNFNKENIASRHKYSFMGFSGGARNCLGKKYAMQYMKVQMTMILRNYSVHTNITMDDIKVKMDMMLRNVSGFPVTIRPRNTRSTFK